MDDDPSIFEPFFEMLDSFFEYIKPPFKQTSWKVTPEYLIPLYQRKNINTLDAIFYMV